ncbi:winged helix-turn-helix domain-containing protein [Aestuariirhabdus sp. LZHN29]|uniref:winged helix-turn-helix domain-containing protein n=1 Tax=Aestuariirhabdus sp. LZHN29 TaxID=3417462 RepID=UPI003CECFD6D
MIYQFKDMLIDTQRYEVRRGGEPVPVEPLLFDLLVYFVSHPGQLFSHDELVQAVWRGRCVSDSTINSAIKNARKALGDNGATQTYIKTVHGRGFRFNGTPQCIPEEGDRVPRGERAEPTALISSPLALLIVPFREIAGYRRLDDYVAGMVADLETILTRVPLLNIQPYGSQPVKEERAISAQQLGDSYGVRYLLQGTGQVAHNRLRINIRLMDTLTGYSLWGELFEEPLDETGLPVTQMTNAVIAKLEPQLVKAMLLSTRSEQGKPSARSLYIEASGILALKGWHQDTFAEAISLLHQTISLDPNFPLARAYLSLVLALGFRFGLLGDYPKAKEEATIAAESALRQDSTDSTVLGFAGCALADLGCIERAKPILQNAIELSPANAQALAALGAVCLMEGDASGAVKRLGRSLEISPLDSRLSVWGAILALALLRSGDLDAAVEQANLACQRDDMNYLPRVALATVLLALGRQVEARSAMKEAYRIKPGLGPPQLESLVGRKASYSLIQLVAIDTD